MGININLNGHCFGCHHNQTHSRYSPLTHPKENAVRRKIVLEKCMSKILSLMIRKTMLLDDECCYTTAFKTVDNCHFRQSQSFLILQMLYIIKFVMICSQSLAILPHNLINFSTAAVCRFIQQWIRPFRLLSMKRSTMLTITSLQQEAGF